MKKKISLSEYPHVLTVKEVAEILRTTPKTVYKLLNDGRIPFMYIGRRKMVVRVHLEEFIVKIEPNYKWV